MLFHVCLTKQVCWLGPDPLAADFFADAFTATMPAVAIAGSISTQAFLNRDSISISLSFEILGTSRSTKSREVSVIHKNSSIE